MSDQTRVDYYLKQHQSVKTALPGASCPELSTVRQTALKAFAKTGFPSRKTEDWKYTSLHLFSEYDFQCEQAVPSDEMPVKNILADSIFSEATHLLVFVDGDFSATLSRIKGLNIQTMKEAIASDPIFIAKRLARPFDADQHAFEWLNQAFVSNGMVLSVPTDIKIKETIRCVHIATHEYHANFIRHLIDVGQNAQLSLSEHYFGLASKPTHTNTLTDIILEKDACIEHTKHIQEVEDAYHIGLLRTRLKENAQVKTHSFALTGRLIRSDVQTQLMGTHARAKHNGLFIGFGQQHFDHQIKVNHVMPACTSDENYKGILDGKTRGVFNGCINVAKDAQKTQATLQNKNLLLSKSAEMDTKPQLEIYADDVRCTHGATVGQLSQEALFYLQSRGLSEKAAKLLLIEAFANELVFAVEDTSLQAYLQTTLTEKIIS